MFSPSLTTISLTSGDVHARVMQSEHIAVTQSKTKVHMRVKTILVVKKENVRNAAFLPSKNNAWSFASHIERLPFTGFLFRAPPPLVCMTLITSSFPRAFALTVLFLAIAA